MKSKLCNRLTDCLDLVMCLFAPKKNMLERFPYHEAILAWKKGKKNAYDR
jgi:hypothetical protein